MQELGQGLVLMLSGMGIVYCFLLVLIAVTKLTMTYIAKFDSILPEIAVKKPAPKAANTADDENIALAIAVALG